MGTLHIPTFRPAGTVEGRDSMEAGGLVAVKPPVRSSDYGLVCQAPFCYFLSRRLGLVKALRWSQALSRGTWFHEAFKHYDQSPEIRRERVESSLELRQSELAEVCNELGMNPDARREIILRERQDADVSLAWFEAGFEAKISDDYGSARSFLSRPYWRVLAKECRLLWHENVGGLHLVPCIAQPDLLLYHEKQGSVWIVDFKTTGISPLLRATSCPHEFQSRHYMHITRNLLRQGVLQQFFDLPTDTRLGGIMHLIVRKPTIEFGMKDRHYEIDDTPFKSGPRKGQPRNEKKYFGEPVWENYLQRVRDWYRCENEYLHNRAEFEADPPVNMSIISGNIIDEECDRQQYRAQLEMINKWRTAKPEPYQFPMPSSIVSFNRLDDYAPFVMNPPSTWPEIIRQEGWMQVSRDDIEIETTPDRLGDIIPEPGSEFD